MTLAADDDFCCCLGFVSAASSSRRIYEEGEEAEQDFICTIALAPDAKWIRYSHMMVC